MPVKSNATGSVFLIAAFLLPTEAERMEGTKKKLVLEPKFVVAEDGEAARTAAVMQIPRDLDPDRCEVLVSLPFGK